MNPQEISRTVAENEGSGQIVDLSFYDLLGSFLGMFGGGIEPAGIISFFSSVWSVYTVLAYIATALFVYGYIYASTRKSEIDGMLVEQYVRQEEQYRRMQTGNVKNERWQDVLTHIDSENPNDWKLAIIEADILLDDAIKERGYAGATLGERLKSISSAHLRTLDDAWEGHKVRNRIAHEGSDFVLTHSLARNTITQYQRVFEELGVT